MTSSEFSSSETRQSCIASGCDEQCGVGKCGAQKTDGSCRDPTQSQSEYIHLNQRLHLRFQAFYIYKGLTKGLV